MGSVDIYYAYIRHTRLLSDTLGDKNIHTMQASRVHIGAAIRAELNRQDKSVTWFAKQLNLQRPNAYRIFNSRSLDSELLYNICCILNHNFFLLYNL